MRYLLADAVCRDDAELIASEFARNALRHTRSGRGTFIVKATRTVETVTVAVYDSGAGDIPNFTRNRSILSSNGRGLAIVATLADAVGFDGNDGIPQPNRPRRA